ncbi:MAG: peptidyl-dipeptidase A [Bacteroidia bacterium]|jgi:peptidyl-dipeptidase A
MYYYMSHTNDSVPIILRGAANRAYHKAMGKYTASVLKQYGLIADSQTVNPMLQLLKESLDCVVAMRCWCNDGI